VRVPPLVETHVCQLDVLRGPDAVVDDEDLHGPAVLGLGGGEEAGDVGFRGHVCLDGEEAGVVGDGFGRGVVVGCYAAAKLEEGKGCFDADAAGGAGDEDVDIFEAEVKGGHDWKAIAWLACSFQCLGC